MRAIGQRALAPLARSPSRSGVCHPGFALHGGYQFVDDDGDLTSVGSTRAGGEGACGGSMIKFVF